jgi:hypothetical protein
VNAYGVPPEVLALDLALTPIHTLYLPSLAR